MQQTRQRPRLDLSPRPVRRAKLFDQVCENLRQYIPALGPNAELNEVELCRQMGLSRTPVREALLHLAGEGLVTLQPNGRRQVVELGHRDAEELYDIRSVLEGLAARLLASKITDDQVTQLRQLAERVDQALSKWQNSKQIENYEIQFHSQVAVMAGNTRLADALQRQGLLMQCLISPGGLENIMVEFQSHVELVDALAAGNPGQAEAMFRRHVLYGKKWVLGALDTKEKNKTT